MGPTEILLCDASGFESALDDLAGQIAGGRRPGVPIGLVGIRTRGVPIALRLAERLNRLGSGPVPVGALEITLYRDDLADGDRWPVLKGTEIPFDVDGLEIVLVDDVLYTGRTIRSALNAICDLGRPSVVRLAVLVDRGHRELPIRADAAGLVVRTGRDESVRVRLASVDGRDEIVRLVPQSIPSSGEAGR